MSDTWTLWGASREIPTGRPLPVTIDGRHLIVWRTASGALSLLDGRCRHLGADLGHVGRIVDGCVRCPFHGWTYDQDGTNVDQPGTARSVGRGRANASLPAYGATETAGLVLVSTTTSSPDPAMESELADAFGVHESMGGRAVAGAAHRWVLRVGDTLSADAPGLLPARKLVEWLLAGREGDRPVAGTDPAWELLRGATRIERSRGPISAINGLHTSAPRVRFLRLSTDPVVELRTVAGGIHVARLQPHPAPLRPAPYRRCDALAVSALRGARAVASVSALTEGTVGITVVGLYPDRRNLGPAVAAAGDLVLRRQIGRRLARLSAALDVTRQLSTMKGVLDDRTHSTAGH